MSDSFENNTSTTELTNRCILFTNKTISHIFDAFGETK